MTDLPRLRDAAELEAAIEASSERPLVLLKHSTRCPISTRAHDEFEKFVAALDPARAAVAVVYVVEERPLSNDVASRFGVRHESPQAFMIVDGKVVWHDSHDGVTAASLGSALDSAAAA